MYRITLFFTLFLVSVNCVAQYPKKTDVAKLGLHGNVKSMVSKYFEAAEKFGELEKTSLSAMYTEAFNKQGYNTSYEKKTSARASSFTETYKYEAGLLVETKLKTYGDVTIEEKLYNKLGQLLEVNNYSDRKHLYFKIKYTWQSFFNKKGYVKYNADGKVNYKITYDYEQNLNKVNNNIWSLIKQWTGIELYENIIIEKKYDENDNLLQYKYIDDDGNVLFIATAIAGEKYGVADSYNYKIYTYNKAGTLLHYYENDKDSKGVRVLVHHVRTPDENGHPVKVTREVVGSNKKTIDEEYSYVYDANKNWIKRTNVSYSHTGKKSFYICEREIKYY